MDNLGLKHPDFWSVMCPMNRCTSIQPPERTSGMGVLIMAFPLSFEPN